MNANNLNRHSIITMDSCIHIQKSLINVPSLKEKFISILSSYGDAESEYYAHIFNCKGFPVNIGSVSVYSCYTYVDGLCSSIYLGLLSNIDLDDIDYDDNFYVFISKYYNDKLELVNL